MARQTWAAYQDGDGAWQVVTPSSTGVYAFNVTGTRYGVAFVCASGDNTQSEGVIHYAPASKTALEVIAGSGCAPVAGPTYYKLGGAFSNLPQSSTYLRVGTINMVQTGSLGSSYTLYNFVAGKSYDIAFGAASDTNLLKVLFTRGIVLNADVLNHDLDFGAGYDVGSSTITVSNATANTSVDAYYSTGGGYGMPLLQGGSMLTNSTLTASYSTIPDAPRVASDRYVVRVSLQNGSDVRSLERRYSTTGTVDLSVPVAFSAQLTATTTPYFRPKALFQLYPGSTHYQLSWAYGPSKGVSHRFSTEIEPAWGASLYNFTFPDFSGLSGFVSDWVPPSGAAAASVYSSAIATVSSTLSDGTLDATAQHSLSLP